MNIPKTVKILYKTYGVEEQENIHDGHDDLYGQIQYLPEKIILNSESSTAQKEATLLHECIHGLDEMYLIGLEEEQVGKLGNALYMLIHENPQMFGGGKS